VFIKSLYTWLVWTEKYIKWYAKIWLDRLGWYQYHIENFGHLRLYQGAGKIPTIWASQIAGIFLFFYFWVLSLILINKTLNDMT
jgi:hypothetical protein